MLVALLNKIIELARPELVHVDDRDYSTHTMHAMRKPSPESLSVHTLSGMVDLIGSQDIGPCVIHIKDEKTVSCLSRIIPPWEQRFCFSVATPFTVTRFPCERYMTIEDFIVSFQSMFEESCSKTQIIDMLASIRGEDVVTATDNGIAQEVVVSSKIGRMEKGKVNPLVQLAPFRTFTDVEQPTSRFLLRLLRREKGLPDVALFEADGGAWKKTAVESIRDWFLKNELIIKQKIDIIA